ncbi:serine/threonine-protein kinase pim-1-like, partial [Anneissia japonica]|uniref:serine/threonine-protein kinase pim-1-like n=1 Tax=Anneissia japonica TaxID=1529436 RepID=UPI0014257CFE
MEKYDLTKHIFNGTFGSVFAGVRRSDQLPVAVKKVKTTCKSYPSDKHGRMVIREVHFLELASDIENCIRLLEWKHVGPHHFLVMERPVNCSDLHQVIEEFGILAENKIRRIFRQTVRACIACAEKRFVHGDIKPENILVDLDRWDAKLIDFGFSRYFDDDRPFFYLEGTTDYLPPEWEREGCVRSLPATVWSLGLVLFEMCTFLD